MPEHRSALLRTASTLARVAQVAGTVRGLEGVHADRIHGASQLADRTLRALSLVRPVHPERRAAEYIDAVVTLAGAAASLRPAMPSIEGALARAIAAFRALVRDARSAGDASDCLRAAVARERSSLVASREAAAIAFHRGFRRVRRAVTLSYSSTLRTALVSPKSRVRKVVVCESRPGYEGRTLARAIAREGPRGTDVTVITEAQCALSIARCDAVILGCDAIFEDGSIVNKCGSFALAAVAKEMRRPVIVLGDRYKMCARRAWSPESLPERRMWWDPRGERARNDIFEIVPARVIGYVVLEDGVHRPRGVRTRWSAEMAGRRALARRRGRRVR